MFVLVFSFYLFIFRNVDDGKLTKRTSNLILLFRDTYDLYEEFLWILRYYVGHGCFFNEKKFVSEIRNLTKNS